MPKMLVMSSFFVPIDGGGHKLLELDDEVVMPDALASEMALLGRVRYLEPQDVPKGVGGAAAAAVHPVHLSAVKARARAARNARPAGG
jgi:hypothetical protein